MVTFSTIYWLTLYLNNKIFMKINAETKYCQTCGIPLDIDYTNLEANQNVEYCDYCLHNGVKLYDFSMDYLIYLWGLFPEEYYKETGVNLTSEELRAEMSKRLPNIKRWKQKINTAHVQYDLIIRVQEYINRHLFDDLDSDKLSHVAGISKYYFRRLFKAVCGENIGMYIQRLRLEYIAFKLITTDVSVPELLGQINYQNKHTFSRAFKSYFNCSIPEFRKKHSKVNPERKNPIRIEPSIEKVPGIRIAYLKLERTNNVIHSFSVLWKQLLQFSEKYELSSKGCKYVSLTLDYPYITPEEQNRFMIGVTLPQSFEAPKGFGVYEIHTGEYAIFRFKGFYHELNKVYRHIYLDWLPTSDYTLREQFTFETYINTPEKTPASELITDIYIPITKKETCNT
ncbi:hypothetical protein HMPREF1212_02106 [Parabacteroides sp. HGS0025]|nr:hypothetical protein HMPREF1212_02106 [Parabacteroides sp. HGS0025]